MDSGGDVDGRVRRRRASPGFRSGTGRRAQTFNFRHRAPGSTPAKGTPAVPGVETLRSGFSSMGSGRGPSPIRHRRLRLRASMRPFGNRRGPPGVHFRHRATAPPGERLAAVPKCRRAQGPSPGIDPERDRRCSVEMLGNRRRPSGVLFRHSGAGPQRKACRPSPVSSPRSGLVPPHGP